MRCSLGDNDAPGADKDLLLFAVDRALAELGLDRFYMAGCNLFLFGSVDSLLDADMRFFDALGGRNCRTYLNIGLESADPADAVLLQSASGHESVAGLSLFDSAPLTPCRSEFVVLKPHTIFH